ncbi:unnamed protein product [Chondrus crispus]|uniref:General transcription factor IIH subunit 4 n=1 Tax=Chondrus crispus TaxID=2769 RepID=R7QRW5_CHOCR|nr:unnamed protein product [Chondrus crispus]CDF40468.1 unnamed protein product [Chondrus crispus]|eukprot:XP_005710762.1 unnamed protein product [Chondrus crispus]
MRSDSAPGLSQSIFEDLADAAAKSKRLITRLYESPHAVQCVFRALPPIARLYVARIIYLPSNQEVSVDSFRQCLRRRQRAYDRHDSAILALKALHVLVEVETLVDGPGRKETRLQLNDKFAENLRRSVTYGVEPVFGGPCEDIEMVDVESREVVTKKMDEFSAAKLDRILNFLVESNGSNAPGGTVVQALAQVGILESKSIGLCITSSGFQFLLKDSFAQLWVLLRSIVNTQFRGEELDAWELIFKLSFACPGKEYRDPHLSKCQRELMAELHELGIVRLGEDATFRPTTVGVRLLTSASRIQSGPASTADASSMVKIAGEIEIFVETNFRVYAYTTSNFQTNLLALFTHMRYKLPSMVVGHLTRDAVRRALMSGITGDQIIGYLNAHAHPRMKRGVIPSNVSDEIRLWEAEQDRVQTTPGVLLSDFESQEAFEKVMSYAYDLGASVWSDRDRLKVIVAREAYGSVRGFMNSNDLH